MTNVLLIPGVTGSSLQLGKLPVWGGPNVNYLTGAGPVIAGGIKFLRLLADGSSEYPVFATGIIGYYYGECQKILGARYNLIPGYYDWRRDPFTAAAEILARVLPTLRGEPFYVVSHSYGTLVTRALYRQLRNKSQLRGAFMLGAPSNGVFETVRTLNGLGRFYSALRTGAMLNTYLTSLPQLPTTFFKSRFDEIDRVVGTLDSVMCMLPRYDPFFRQSYWAGKNAYVTQDVLTRAKAYLAIIDDVTGELPKDTINNGVGDFRQTYYNLRDVSKGSSDLDYDVTTLGDGAVTIEGAVIRGEDVLVHHCDHIDEPNDYRYLDAIEKWIDHDVALEGSGGDFGEIEPPPVDDTKLQLATQQYEPLNFLRPDEVPPDPLLYMMGQARTIEPAKIEQTDLDLFPTDCPDRVVVGNPPSPKLDQTLATTNIG